MPFFIGTISWPVREWQTVITSLFWRGLDRVGRLSSVPRRCRGWQNPVKNRGPKAILDFWPPVPYVFILCLTCLFEKFINPFRG